MSRAVKRALSIARRQAKRYADGGPVKYTGSSEESPDSQSRLPYGRHRLETFVPLTSSTDLTGRLDATPQMYGPGRHDVGARIGIRSRFADGGPATDTEVDMHEALERGLQDMRDRYEQHREINPEMFLASRGYQDRSDLGLEVTESGISNEEMLMHSAFNGPDEQELAAGGVADPEDEALAFADRQEPESWEPPSEPFEANYPEPVAPPVNKIRKNVVAVSAHTQGRPAQVERPVGTGEQSVTEYHPTVRENLGAYLLGDQPSEQRRRLVKEGIGSTGLGEHLSVSDVTPIGMGLQLQEALQHGDPQSAALAIVPGPGGIKKAGKEAVHYWSQNIADELVHRHGPNGFEGINNALYELSNKTSPKVADAIFGKLPEEVRQGIIENIPPFNPLGRTPAKAEREAERAFNEEHRQFLQEPSGPQHELAHPVAPRFREVTHPEEAKDWLRDHGHNPDDWGYSDPENYIELANRLKKEEMGLRPATSQTPASPVPRRRPTPSEDPHEDFAGLKDDLKIAEAKFNAKEGMSEPDLDHLFSTMGARDVAEFPDELMTDIRKTLSRHPNPERLRAEDENLWNAIHQRFDDMDQQLDERMAWAGEPRREQPSATVTPIHPGPFSYTTEYGTPLSARDVNRLSTYFDETMRSRTGNRGPLFKDQADFAENYFGGMNTNRVTAVLTSDPHGSNSPAFRFQGALLNPNNREFVAEIDRYIIPEQKYAYHGLLSVEPKYQSGEFAPQMLRNQIDLYKALDLNYVSLGAGLDSGPYTWLKYGWIPNQHGWDTIRQRTQNYLTGGQLRVSNKEVREGLNKILSDKDPRSAWDLADVTATDDFGNEIGRTVFLGYKTRNSRNIRFDAQGWRGQLNLKNAASMERFDEYFRRQTEKKAGKAKPKPE